MRNKFVKYYIFCWGNCGKKTARWIAPVGIGFRFAWKIIIDKVAKIRMGMVFDNSGSGNNLCFKIRTLTA